LALKASEDLSKCLASLPLLTGDFLRIGESLCAGTKGLWSPANRSPVDAKGPRYVDQGFATSQPLQRFLDTAVAGSLVPSVSNRYPSLRS
jgi:hypothetical protein